MRILLVSQFYPPELGAASVRMSELAEHLARAGDAVHVVTGMPNYPSGRVDPSYRRRPFISTVIAGVKVWRGWLYPAESRGFLRRSLNHLSFGLTAFVLTLAAPRFDVVLTQSPPLLAPAFVGVGAWMRGARSVVYVSDLHPESAVGLRQLDHRVLIALAQALVGVTYRLASGLIATSPGIRAGLLSQGVPPAKVQVIPGGSDAERFRPGIPSRWRSAAGLEANFVALYAGMLGHAQAFDVMLRAAAELRDDPGIRIVVVGDGPARRSMENARPPNVLLFPAEPPERMPDIVAGADVCLVLLRDLPALRSSVPAKMFEAMAAGKPVVLVAPSGDASRILVEAGCGEWVEGEDPHQLALVLKKLRDDPARASRMGVAGRSVAVRKYSRGQMADKVRRYLQSFTGGTSESSR